MRKNQKMKIRGIVIILISFFMLSASNLKIKSNYVHIADVEGDVSYWPTLASGWKKLKKNTNIRIGSLIQFDFNSSVKIKIKGGISQSIGGKNININVKTPICMRIDKNMLRETKFSENYISKLQNSNIADSPAGNEDQFENAWNKVITFLNPSEANKNMALLNIQKNLQGDDFNLSKTVGKIKMISPDNNDSIFSATYPSYLDISWEKIKEEKDISYKVYIWKAEESKDKAFIGNTGETYYQALIQTPGSYYIQISDVLKRYMSKPISVHLSSPDFMYYTFEDKKKRENVIELVNPYDDSLIILKKGQKSVVLSWILPKNNSVVNVNVHIKKINESIKEGQDLSKNDEKYSKETIYKTGSGEQFTEIELENGKYLWWLEGILKETALLKNQVKITSEDYIFTVDKKKSGKFIDFEKLISDRKIKSVYIENKEM